MYHKSGIKFFFIMWWKWFLKKKIEKNYSDKNKVDRVAMRVVDLTLDLMPLRRLQGGGWTILNHVMTLRFFSHINKT